MRRIVGAMGLAVMVAGPAAADDGPLIVHRTGLWEQTVTAPHVPPQVRRMCFSPEYDARLWAEREAHLGPGCQPGQVERTAEGGSSRMVCRRGSGTATTDMTVARTDGQIAGEMGAFRMEIRTVLDPAPSGLTGGVTVTMAARWVGPCPAGIAPGDFVDAQGRPVEAEH